MFRSRKVIEKRLIAYTAQSTTGPSPQAAAIYEAAAAVTRTRDEKILARVLTVWAVPATAVTYMWYSNTEEGPHQTNCVYAFAAVSGLWIGAVSYGWFGLRVGSGVGRGRVDKWGRVAVNGVWVGAVVYATYGFVVRWSTVVRWD